MSREGGLVDCQHQLQCVSPCHSVDIWRAVLPDGINHICIERYMSVAINIAGSFLEALRVRICLQRMGELPNINLISRGSSKFNGSVLSEQVQRLL